MNPHKLSLGPGGSSSGEGALVGFRGSVLGLGSDIGGSIRCPSLCNGIYGIKLSSDRLPYAKQQGFFPKGWPSIVCSLGPHAHSARDLTLFCKTVIQAKPWWRDSTAYAIPWRDVPKKKILRIGAWLDDPSLPVLPPVARILGTAIQKLRAAGHELIILSETPSLMSAGVTALRSFSLDTKQTVKKLLSDGDEELHPSVQEAISQTFESHQADLTDVWAVNAAKEDLREEWAKIWRKHELDVLLTPSSRSTAVPHGTFGAPLWTVIWNLLDVCLGPGIRF